MRFLHTLILSLALTWAPVVQQAKVSGAVKVSGAARVTTPAGVVVTKVQGGVGTATSGTTVAVTLSAAPVTGHIVACAILYFSGGASGTTITTIQDGNSNAYTVTGNSPSTYDSNAGQIHMAYLLSAPANAHATITVTFANSIGGAAAIWAEEFSVTGGTAAFDTDAKGTGTGTPINTPSITPAGSHELFMGGAAYAASISSANSPWTGADGGTQFGCYAEYALDISAATALNFTGSAGATWSSMSMAFKFT